MSVWAIYICGIPRLCKELLIGSILVPLGEIARLFPKLLKGLKGNSSIVKYLKSYSKFDFGIDKSISKLEVIEVGQREYNITSSEDKKYILATGRTNQCTLFYGYDRTNKLGFLCHIDFPSGADSVFNILKEVSNKPSEYPKKFDAYIAGGKYGLDISLKTRERLIEVLSNSLPFLNLEVNLNVLPYTPGLRQITLSIDTKNGFFGKYRNTRTRQDHKPIKNRIHLDHSLYRSIQMND